MKLLLKAGRLISTTDHKAALFLQQMVSLEQLIGAENPQNIRRTKDNVSFTLNGNYYELEAVL